MKNERPLSYSALKTFAKSPNHLLAYWNRDLQPTPAMIKGSLIHTLILEPNTFESRYAVFDGGRRAGGIWESFQAANVGKEIIKREELNEVETIVNGCKKNVLLNLKKGVEKMIEWELEKVAMKGVIDAYGDGFILDVKTCSDASPDSFNRDFYKMKYHWQAYLYLTANEKLNFAGSNPDYYILAVETSEPYNSQIYRISPKWMKIAESEVKQLLIKYKHWDGKPCGYDFHNALAEDGVLDLHLLPWLGE